MNRIRMALFGILLFTVVSNPGTAWGQLGKVFARAAERNLARTAERSWLSIFRRDMVRDRATSVEKLTSNRSVFRYTTKPRARLESHVGISKGSHLTSHAAPGRPSAHLAQQRFGLPVRPSVRETVVLPKGTTVQMNKSIGGRPGYGEIRLAQRVKPESIRRSVPLPRANRHPVTGGKHHR